MTTTHKIADAVGRKKIARTIGVNDKAVSNAVVRGSFPPSWFLAVKSLAEQVGEDCPPQLFNMKEAPPLNVDATPTIQPPATKRKRRGRV